MGANVRPLMNKINKCELIVYASAWPQAYIITHVCFFYFDRFYEEPAIVECGWYVASGVSLINMVQHIILGA